VSLTRRGKITTGALASVAVLGGVGALALTGHAPAPLQRIVAPLLGRPTPCPLTGEALRGDRDAPSRPAFAVKVENTEAAYPLAGLDRADVIYEELVEGGITRFVVIFQCREASRVGPVRSARTTDPKLLMQYADAPLLAYSGAAKAVTAAVDRADITSFTETTANDAFSRDETRVAPHNLYVSVQGLYRAAKAADADLATPRELFAYGDELPRSKPRRTATVTFSSSTTAEWGWSGDAWVRQLDGAPMLLDDGNPIRATNVVIQEVEVRQSAIVDASGSYSPIVDVTGTGRGWVLRDGRLIVGRWTRPSLGDLTVFETKTGERILLAPGTTFVELVPADQGSVAFER
jgi:hypothetical protein